MNNVARIITVFVVAAFVAAAAAFIVPGMPRAAPDPLLEWQDAKVVARGEAVYAAQCASCHGAVSDDTGAADPNDPTEPAIPSHGADGHTWEHPDFALVQLTKTGEVAELCKDVSGSDMPEFDQALTDREIVDVLSYIKSTWPAEIRAQHDEINLIYAGQNRAVRDLLDLSEH